MGGPRGRWRQQVTDGPPLRLGQFLVPADVGCKLARCEEVVQEVLRRRVDVRRHSLWLGRASGLLCPELIRRIVVLDHLGKVLLVLIVWVLSPF